MTVSLNAVLPFHIALSTCEQFADRQAALARHTSRWRVQFRSPELCHLVATVNPDEIVRGAKSASWKRSGAEYSLSGRVPRVCLKPATAAANGNGYLKGNHVFLLVDGELFHLFREFHRRMISGFHANVFSLILRKIPTLTARINCYGQVRDSYRHQNVQHRRAVIHRITLHCQRLCCGLSPRMTKNRLLRSCLLSISTPYCSSLNGQKRRR